MTEQAQPKPKAKRSLSHELHVRVSPALYRRCIQARGELTLNAWLILVLRWYFALEKPPVGPPPPV